MNSPRLEQSDTPLPKPPVLLILGGGALASECYAPALARLGWLENTLFVDRSEAAASTVRQVYPQARFQRGDYAAVLRDKKFMTQFQGVVIALPNSLHEEAVTLSLDAGVDVLCEKPLALDVEICEKLGRAAEERGRQLAIGMVRRFIPSIATIGNAIHNGLLGEVREVEIEQGGAFAWPSDSGSYFRKENGGVFVNMGIHFLDILESWLGPLTPVAYRDDYEGGVEANCEFRARAANGAPVRLQLSNTHDVSNRIIVRGERGEITTTTGSWEKVEWTWFDSGVRGELRAEKPYRLAGLPFDFVSAFCEQFLRFADVLAGRAKPHVSAREAARTQGLIEWGYAHRTPWTPRRDASARPRLDPGRAFVTGGTGFLGGRLVARLCELGFGDIVVPVRSYRSGANVACFPVERVLTDLFDPQSVRNALAGARYVFHLAFGTQGPDGRSVTVDGTRNIVEAAIAAGAEAVVVVSTTSVFGSPKTDKPIDEASPYNPSLGDYGKTKADMEKYTLERAKTSASTRIAVICPSVIYGPTGKLFTEFPVRATAEGTFAWIEEGRGRLNYTFVDNVVDALILAASSPEAHGERFIVNDGVCTMREFLTKLLGPAAESLRSYSHAELLAAERRNRPTFRDLARGLMNPEVMQAVNGIPILAAPKKFVERRLASTYSRMQTARAEMRAEVPTASSAALSPSAPSWLAEIFGPMDVEYSSAKAQRVLHWTPLVNLDAGVEASREWLRATGIVRS